MKTLMTLSSGVEISMTDSAETIHFDDSNCFVYGSSKTDELRLCVLFRYQKKQGDFGVLRGSDSQWRLHMSTEEAMQLHALLPNVEFEDERVGAAESLADNGGVA